ncbi:MAG: hypothetical protein D6746_09430 [Bacteroidetes bacterium]|nr:MAG: hypothetical protein D6746_09430 [Bacteroidota bacterium]
MAVWHLIETDRPDRTARAGFTVVDAARRCTGTVNGWIVGPNGAIAFLRVMMPGVTGSGHLLLPVGLIDRIDDTRSCLYLRPGATRHLHPACHVSGSPLPPPDRLAALEARYPPLPPALARRLSALTRLRGSRPPWRRLEHYPAPAWCPLSVL